MAMQIHHMNFSLRLFRLLSDEDPRIVCFVENGTAFKVFDNERFVSEILPKYYRHSKIESFHRQLNLYGFKRTTKGANIGAYYHPMLVQDREELVPFIRKEILDQTDRIERYLAGLFLTPEGSKCNSSKPSKKCSGMKEEASETPFERIQREASKVLHKMWDFDFMFSAEQERVTGTSNESCDDELDEDLMELI